MEKSELIEAVMIAIPYPQHITDIDLSDPEEGCIRLTWRGDRFRIRENMVEEVRDRFLHGSNLAILFESLVKVGIIQLLNRKSKHEVAQ